MSSGSDSDEDFVPEEPEQLSEEGSADEETDLQYEKELENKIKKRKAEQYSIKSTKKRRTRKGGHEVEELKEKKEEPKLESNPEHDKKREDDLWAMFLEGTDTKPKPANQPNLKQSKKVNDINVVKTETKVVKESNEEDNDKARERRIFEFAGETIVVENNVIKEKIKSDGSDAVKLEGPSTMKRGVGGLSNVIGQLNRKNKLSTLEKSKLDWDTYKQEEGIEEEVQHHNKGKSGYLDRQDFLERADHRQFEIERELRMSRRSNR